MADDINQLPKNLRSADRLTSQLYHLPSIVGRLGLSIANAQKALNADYLDNVKVLLGIAQQVLRGSGADEEQLTKGITSLLQQLAPSRYQFTETTIDFSADLSETFSLAGSAGLGAGFGAVMVNAALSVGFGHNYRAAARIKSVLHAIPANEAMVGTFLNRAAALDENKLGMPALTEVDEAQTNAVADIMSSLGRRDIGRLPQAPDARAAQAAADAKRQAADAKRFAAEAAKLTAAADKDKHAEAVRKAKSASETAQAAAKSADDASKAAAADKSLSVERQEAAATDAKAAADAAAEAAKAVEGLTE